MSKYLTTILKTGSIQGQPTRSKGGISKITSSVDATNKKRCKNQKQIHHKQTRANTSIPPDPVEIIDNIFYANPGIKLQRVELVEQGKFSNKSLSPLTHKFKTTPPIISQKNIQQTITDN